MALALTKSEIPKWVLEVPKRLVALRADFGRHAHAIVIDLARPHLIGHALHHKRAPALVAAQDGSLTLVGRSHEEFDGVATASGNDDHAVEVAFDDRIIGDVGAVVDRSCDQLDVEGSQLGIIDAPSASGVGQLAEVGIGVHVPSGFSMA